MANNESSVKMEKSMVMQISDERAAEEIKRLKLLIQQKDNEMALLVSLIKKKSGENNCAVIPGRPSKEEENLLRSVVKEKPMHFPSEEPSKLEETKMQSKVEESHSNFEASKAPRSLVDADK